MLACNNISWVAQNSRHGAREMLMVLATGSGWSALLRVAEDEDDLIFGFGDLGFHIPV